ncbi:MAG: tetratricopeptide repeat protein [Acidobacteria bacterium]|nr:tetratricopeptide repeat protein [Acidobacteriota bacterium]
MPRFLRGSLALAVLAVLACAPAVRPRFPEGEDYVFPVARAGELRAEEARRVDEAWRDVLAGRSSSAQKDFRKLLERRPDLVPARVGLAYALLRAGRFDEAGRGFEAALASRPDYLPGLLGAGSAAVRRRDPERALAYYRRALAVDATDATVRRRLGEVKLQVTERRVAEARGALGAGDPERAIEEFARALDVAPELGGLRVELAELLAGRGEIDEAVALLRADPGGDRQVMFRLGDVLSERGDHAGALEAYRRALTRDPKDAEALQRALDARRAWELQQMPPEYQRIFAAPRITRADLAALVAVKVGALARMPRGEPRVAVDISGSWAREHILEVLALDVMDVYPNHTFQPAAMVRRGDLARAVARVLDLLKVPTGAGPVLKDMSANNLFHGAASRAVATGLMDLTPEGAFEAWRPVSGQDAAAVVEALVRLVGP